jgi:hypothetical protein
MAWLKSWGSQEGDPVLFANIGIAMSSAGLLMALATRLVLASVSTQCVLANYPPINLPL